ncbi:MAG TPA: type II secretion system F family protein [Dongiaceae bacterium]|nr:type II secretion system F family protein [Dongiaceae bacterium]
MEQFGVDFSTGFNMTSMIVLIVFVATIATIFALALPFMRGERFEQRLRAVRDRRRALSTAQTQSFQARNRLQAVPNKGIKGFALRGVSMADLIDAKELRTKLARAGKRSPSAVANYLFKRIALPITFVIISLLYAWIVFPEKPLAVRLAGVLAAGAIGYLTPQILLSNAITKRQKLLQRAFPDALDLIVICVESGMSIEAAFNKVTEQMAETSPEMSEEMGLTSAELAFLSDRRQAFENLSDRTGLPSFKSLATTLLQSERYGTPIANGLRVLAQENRDTRMSLAEKKAASLPAQLTVPMIIFFLPVLFIIIAAPAGIQIVQMLSER